jgi:hypothetical protein
MPYPNDYCPGSADHVHRPNPRLTLFDAQGISIEEDADGAIHVQSTLRCECCPAVGSVRSSIEKLEWSTDK